MYFSVAVIKLSESKFTQKIGSWRRWIMKNICVTNLDFWEIINLNKPF